MSNMAGIWHTRGFEAFRQGTFGNAGQNTYVSRAGVLQRIHLFDCNKDGYVDLLFCNAQAHLESPPAYVYADVLNDPQRTELLAEGAGTGVVADLDGDGYADLVIGNEKSGEPGHLNAFIYYGAAAGLSERYRLLLPAHRCTSATCGDFNGDGRPDLAFVADSKVRLYYQSELAFEAKIYTDLDLPAAAPSPAGAGQLGAADLDGDGYADLYVHAPGGPPRIYWGGADGINPERYSEVLVGDESDTTIEADLANVSEEERVSAAGPLAQIIDLGGTPHLFVPFANRTLLVPVGADRTCGAPLSFDCRGSLSVASGDLNGNGCTDLVFVGRDRNAAGECSWVYWGGPDGFAEARRTALPTDHACDVAVGDLGGEQSGCADVVVCQKQSAESYSTDSLVYRGGAEGIDPEPVRLATHGARRVFIARTADTAHPQVIFINQVARTATNDVDSDLYYGGPDGFSPDRVTKLWGRGATSGLICDLDDNGWPDVIIANSAENAIHLDPGSFIFRGGPDGYRHQPDTVIPTRYGWGVATADLNRNGYLDLVLSRFHDATIEIYYGTANGLDLEHPEQLYVLDGPDDYIPPRRVFLADLNQNGWLDMVVGRGGTNRAVILWGGPDGFDPDRRQVLPVSTFSGFPIARDLTGNGYPDLIIGGGKPTVGAPHDAYTHIFWNGPAGLRADRQAQLPANAASGIAVADFNNDGYPDIFTCSYQAVNDRDIDSYIYWGGPGGSFSAKNRARLRTHSASGCIAADFNEDGYIDIAVANHKSFGDHVGDSFVLWNGPDGIDDRHPTRLPTAGPHGMLQVQPGNILDGSEREYYTSAPFELPAGAAVTRIGWEAELGPKTWVGAQLRSAPTAEALEQADWVSPDNGAGWFTNDQQTGDAAAAGQWMQYRLALGAVNSGSTPRVTEVRVHYS